MAQQLRVLSVLTEGPGSVTHNRLLANTVTSIPGDPLPSASPGACKMESLGVFSTHLRDTVSMHLNENTINV